MRLFVSPFVVTNAQNRHNTQGFPPPPLPRARSRFQNRRLLNDSLTFRHSCFTPSRYKNLAEQGHPPGGVEGRRGAAVHEQRNGGREGSRRRRPGQDGGGGEASDAELLAGCRGSCACSSLVALPRDRQATRRACGRVCFLLGRRRRCCLLLLWARNASKRVTAWSELGLEPRFVSGPPPAFGRAECKD